MIFSSENAGQWVASKDDVVVAASPTLSALMRKVKAREDRMDIRFDRVPEQPYFVGGCGV